MPVGSLSPRNSTSPRSSGRSAAPVVVSSIDGRVPTLELVHGDDERVRSCRFSQSLFPDVTQNDMRFVWYFFDDDDDSYHVVEWYCLSFTTSGANLGKMNEVFRKALVASLTTAAVPHPQVRCVCPHENEEAKEGGAVHTYGLQLHYPENRAREDLGLAMAATPHDTVRILNSNQSAATLLKIVALCPELLKVYADVALNDPRPARMAPSPHINTVEIPYVLCETCLEEGVPVVQMSGAPLVSGTLNARLS